LANNYYTLLFHECVLTPHKKEMLRLLKTDNLSEEILIQKTKKFSEEKKVLIVLKGSPTIIFHPNKDPLTIFGGDPGLARAGTGDVLTGMIASLGAQKLDLYTACILAVNLHFKAGEIAAKNKTSYSMIATDVIDSISDAIKFYLK
jgi:NAD(P)H-hydrate epimerase